MSMSKKRRPTPQEMDEPIVSDPLTFEQIVDSLVTTHPTEDDEDDEDDDSGSA